MRAPYVLLFTVALVPLRVLAKVGGGEHYTDDTSSDDGGDDGLGQILFLLIELAFRYPKVGVPLLIIFAVGFLWMKRQRAPGSAAHRALQHAKAQQRTQVTEAERHSFLEHLRAKDPSFDPAAFAERVKAIFMDLQEAWFRRNLQPVRPLLSDATYQRLTSQLDLLHRQGVRDAIADLQVLDVALIGLEENPHFDTVHVRIQAQMRDTDVAAHLSDEEARAAALRARPEASVEVWSFVRKPGAQTRAHGPSAQGQCPNCGAPFTGGATNTCEFCKAIVNSGNYDWVLAEITQGVEHVGPSPRAEGLDAARQADPGFTVEALEDRASLIFWKWISAQTHSEPRELSKLATPEYLARLEAEIRGLEQRKLRRVFLQCAVGGLNLERLQLDAGGWDEARLEVRWSARMGLVPEGQPQPEFPPTPQRWVFSLRRRGGATTRTDQGMATSRCPVCNAPLTDSLTTSCDFCNAELSSGERDWVLFDASPRT